MRSSPRFSKPSGTLLVVIVLGLVRCASPQPDASASREAILGADRAFARSVAEHDLERFGELVDPDAAFFGTGLLRGRDEVVRGWTPIVRGEIDLSWAPDEAHVAASGDLGFTIGTAEFRSVGEDGTPRISRSRYLTVWRRGDDGEWRAVADAGTSPEPVTSAARDTRD